MNIIIRDELYTKFEKLASHTRTDIIKGTTFEQFVEEAVERELEFVEAEIEDRLIR